MDRYRRIPLMLALIQRRGRGGMLSSSNEMNASSRRIRFHRRLRLLAETGSLSRGDPDVSPGVPLFTRMVYGAQATQFFVRHDARIVTPPDSRVPETGS